MTDDPSPTSPRAADALTLHTFVAPPYDEVWEDEPVVGWHLMTVLATFSIEQHLEALARTLDAVPLPYSDRILMRSVLETAARGWWLLDPDLDPIARLGRYVCERRFAFRQEVIVYNNLGPVQIGGNPPRTALKAARHKADSLDAAARQLNVEVPRRPSSTSLIGDLLGSAGLGRIIYHHASTVAHASFTGLLCQLLPGSVEENGQMYGQFGFTSEDPCRSILLAMAATERLAERLITYSGRESAADCLAFGGIAEVMLQETLDELERLTSLP